ncbi:MAG: hypothetical protein M1503_03355 [Thaumarchaeota archaeon]|nr:hypothetical protein [Nitrososphaerota archaeon]MCL5317290.1 hypothetical protein [Nitrososphaerota archaeon]
MGLGRAVVNIVISIVGALVPLLFLSGSFSPFGAYMPNLFGDGSQLGSMLGISSQSDMAILPFGAAGITGLVLYSVLQRILGAAQQATYSMSQPDPAEMMRSMQNQMPWMSAQGTSTPKNLPADMTKSQFTVLQKYSEGQKNPKNVAKILSMDKHEVEKETETLRANGYLTKDNKLTSKGMEVVKS